MSDRVALMKGGRIAQLGSAEDLYERPASRFVAEFIGESNLLEGHVEAAAGGGVVFVRNPGVRVRLAPGPRALPTGQPSTLMVRPEKIGIGPAATPPDEGLAGTVEEAVYVGEFTRYRVRVAPDVLVSVKVPNTRAVYRAKPDDPVQLHWAVDDGYLVPRDPSHTPEVEPHE